MRGLLFAVGITVAGILVLGLFIALLGPETGPVRAANAPGVAGQFDYQFVMGFAVIGGWATFAGVENAWTMNGEDLGMMFADVAVAVLLGSSGLCAVLFAEFGWEALGVGLGGSS